MGDLFRLSVSATLRMEELCILPVFQSQCASQHPRCCAQPSLCTWNWGPVHMQKMDVNNLLCIPLYIGKSLSATVSIRSGMNSFITLVWLLIVVINLDIFILTSVLEHFLSIQRNTNVLQRLHSQAHFLWNSSCYFTACGYLRQQVIVTSNCNQRPDWCGWNSIASNAPVLQLASLVKGSGITSQWSALWPSFSFWCRAEQPNAAPKQESCLLDLRAWSWVPTTKDAPLFKPWVLSL